MLSFWLLFPFAPQLALYLLAADLLSLAAAATAGIILFTKKEAVVVAMTAMMMIPILLVVIFPLICCVVIGVFVYRDASKRRMNKVLWALVAALTPAFVGLIIYLIVRESGSGLQCPGWQANL